MSSHRGYYKNETGGRGQPPAYERRGNRRPPESSQRDDLANVREILVAREIGGGRLDRALQLRCRRLEARVTNQRPEVRVADQRYEVPVADERHEAGIGR